MRPGDRRLMMPNQILSQPIGDPLPGAGVRSAVEHRRFSRRELFTSVWKPRFARRRSAVRRVLFPRGAAGRSPGGALDGDQSDHEDAQR